MFTVGAFFGILLIGWRVDRINRNERAHYEGGSLDTKTYLATLHARQDLKLIVFLLFGLLIMLGVIADLLLVLISQ